jgi:hypothetical protein
MTRSTAGVGMTDFGLMPLDVLGSDEELRARARAAPAAPAGDPEGRDAGRTVVVRFDRRGIPTAVEISAYWNDTLTPDGLRQALLAAYRAAFDAAVTALRPIDGERSTPPPPPPPPPPPLPLPPPEPGHADDADWFDAVRRELDATDERLARNAELLTSGPAGRREVAGPAGLVRLTVDGFTVTDVHIDARVALHESANRIAADALAAFRAAVTPPAPTEE